MKSLITEIQSSKYIPKDWLYICIKLKKWITGYRDIISNRFSPNIFIESFQVEQKLKVIDASLLNSENKGHILLDNDNRIINKNIFVKDIKINPLTMVEINEKHLNDLASIIENVIVLANDWLELTDNEIILDHTVFKLRKKQNNFNSK